MGKHHILTNWHAPKQVLGDLCVTDVKRIAPQYSTIELVLSHNDIRYIHYQNPYMNVERVISLWPNNDRQTEFVSKEFHMQTEQNALKET